MTLLLRLSLICALIATSLGLGVARGQMHGGTVVELCSGATMTVFGLGGDEGHTQLCPDMAQVLLAGFDSPPVLPARVRGAFATSWPTHRATATVRHVLAWQARGPPARSA